MRFVERSESLVRVFLLAMMMVCLCGTTAWAQDYSGRALFDQYCLNCHGPQGKGDGSFAEMLRIPPADLTQITAQAGGTYPAEQVFRIIDGGDPVDGHGGGDMPLWGDAFSRTSEGNSPEDVKAKIDALVRYIRTLQPKS